MSADICGTCGLSVAIAGTNLRPGTADGDVNVWAPPFCKECGFNIWGNKTVSHARVANTGHGHVWPRPDGVKARCGGPGLCKECSAQQAQKLKADGGPDLTGFAAGDGRVVWLGHFEDADGRHGGSGMRVIMEFPMGPPDLPLSVVFDSIPVTVQRKS